MKGLIVLIIFLPFIFPDRVVTCTNEFTLVGGKCLKLFDTPTSRKNATKTCSTFAGNLVTIKNAEENEELRTFVENSTKRVWIGLYCFSNDPTNCFWDDEFGTAAAYNNFASNFPFIEIDNCIFYKTTGSWAGKWLSGDCDEDMRSFVCELPTTFEDSCELNFDGYCYIPSDNTSFTEAIGAELAHLVCDMKCSQVLSIHSSKEVRYVLNAYKDSRNSSILLGLFSRSGQFHHWLDGSPWNYSNFNKLALGSGLCVSMALKTKNNQVEGTWIYDNCNLSRYMCKRPAGIPCNRDQPQTTTVIPLASSNCNSFLMTSGSFSSPNYPENYPNFINCSYSLATIGSQRIRLTLMDIKIEERYDSIKIYDGDSVESPLMASLSGNYSESSYYTSSSNTLFVTFTSDGTIGHSGFRGSFLSIK